MTHGVKQRLEMTEHKFKPVEEQLAYIKKGVAEIIPESELVAKLEASRKTGKPLRVYLAYLVFYLLWFLLLTFIASFGLIAEA